MSGPTDEYELGLPTVRVQQILPDKFGQHARIVPVASDSGDYYVLNNSGKVVRVETANSAAKYVANFNRPIRLLPCNKGVVVVSEDGIVFRQAKDEHSALRELSYLPKSAHQCYVEFTPRESLLPQTPAIINFLQRLREAAASEPFNVEIPNVEALLKEISQLYRGWEKWQNEPLISLVAVLYERLRYYLQPTKPYTELEPNSSFPGLEFTNCVSMNSEMARRLSFYNWPRTDCLHVTPENLAAAGFFSRPGANNTDRVMCFSCNLYLVNWEAHDEPMQEHEKHGRTCPFVQNSDQRNVTADQTMSVLPMRRWSDIYGSNDVQFTMDDIIVGEVNPDSTWISVAVPPRAPSQKPTIFLFDLTKVAAEPVEILLDLYATCMVETMGLNTESISNPQKTFNWLSSVDEIPSDSIDPQPLCKISALATSTSFDECTVTLRGEKIVALLCAAVSVDDNRLGKSLQQSETGEISALNTLNRFQEDYNTIADNFFANQKTSRRPFILVYHVVEFPDESLMTPLEYANLALRGAKGLPSSAHHSTVVTGQTDAAKTWPEGATVDVEEILSAPDPDVFFNVERGSRDPEFVPVYYNSKKIAAVGIQCIRLPPEYDCTLYQIDQIRYHSSGAFIVASVNAIVDPWQPDPGSVSALLVYSRVSMLHMLNEKPIATIPFKLRIVKVALLEEDFFGSTNMPRENALSTDVLNETVIVLFEDGSAQIVDLDYRRTVCIDCPPLMDIAVNESGDITGLTSDGDIISIEVVHSLPKLKGDLIEELAISVLAASEKSGVPILQNERIEERLSRIANETPKFIEVESAFQNTCICSQHPLSVEQLSWIWSLTRSDARIRPSLSTQAHGSNSTGSARSHPSISHNTQSTVGVAVQIPVEFTEYINAGLRERHHPAILSTPMCQLFCVLNKYPYSDIQTLTDELTRTWLLKPKKDTSRKTYVFELSITFGLSLSHINLSLGLAGYVRGVSDVRMSIFIPKSSEGSLGEEAAKFFGDDGSASSLPGPSSGLSAEHYLSMFGEKPDVLEQNYNRCIGPLNIEEFIDANNKQAVIQLSVVQLLLAAARTELKQDGKVHFDEGWMFHSQRFYVLVEVNERSTASQKTYCQILHANTHEHRHQDLQPVGSKRTRSMDTSAGGIVPLPLFKSTDRRKHLMKARGSSRKRFVQNFAETVTQSAMKPYSLGSMSFKVCRGFLAADTALRSEGPILTCLEYITLTALKSTDKQTRSNMQRCLLLLDTPSHSEILRAAVGIIPKAESTNRVNTADSIPYYRMLIAQQQSWDILHWIATQLRISRDQERAIALAATLKALTYEFVYNCFVVSPRSIARKAAGFLLEMMDLLRILEETLADEILNAFLDEITALLSKESRFRHSGAMRWLTTLLTELMKSACVRPLNSELRAKVAQLAVASSKMVTKIGEVWHSRRSAQRLALSPSEFCPDPLTETNLFEFPPQVAAIVVDTKLIGAAHSAAQTMFAHYKFGESLTEAPKEKPEIAVPNVYAAAASDSNGVSSVKAYKSSRSSSSQSRPYHKENAWINELTPLATVYVLDELKEADIKWFEHVGLSTLEPVSYPTKRPPVERIKTSHGPVNLGVSLKKQPYTINEDIFRVGQSISPTDTVATNLENGTLADVLLNLQGNALFDELRNRFSHSQIRRFLITSEHLPGLIEVERLNFNINSSTVQLRILDLNALSDVRIEAERPVSSLMDAMPGPKVYFASNSELRTPLPMSEPMIAKRGFMPGQSKNLSSVQSETEQTHADIKLKSLAELYVLERRRTFTERRRLLPSTPPTSIESAPQSSQTPASAFFSAEQALDLNFDVMDTTDGHGSLQPTLAALNQAPKASVIDNPIITRRSSSYVCEMNGCTAGQIFQIVLNFQTPFLLTDFLIPSNEVFSSVAVDGWLEDERHGIIRFAYSVEIENRCLIVSDVMMTSPIQFIRLTFAVRDSRTSEVTFMIGQFFGTRFFSPWHLYSSSGVFDADKYWDMEPMEIVESVLPFVDPHSQSLQKAVEQLEQLAQSVLLRFQSNLSQIRATARHGCSFNNKRLYQQCIADRILYNTYRNILERSRRDMLFASSVLYRKDMDHETSLSNIACAKDWNGHEEPSIDFITEQSDSFWDASSDELRFMAVEFMNVVNEANSFMQIGQRISSKFEKKNTTSVISVYQMPEMLTLESAVRLFGCFVCDMDPRLEALCCAYLFHQGSKSDWWPDFFPAVIRRHFVASSYNSSDFVFIRLAYLCDQSVRYRDLQIPIFERLLSYTQELVTGKSNTVDTTQLSWLLMLMSSACDAVIPNDRHMDRWSFICGQPCSSYPHAPSGEPVRRYSRKTGAAFKDQFFASQYGPTYSGFGFGYGYAPYTSSFGDAHPPPMPDHASMVEMKKLGSEIKQSGKQLDTLLQNSQLSSDDYLPLKKEQKTLMSLFNTSQTYICKGVQTQDSFVEKIHSGGLIDKADSSDAKKAPLATQEDDLATDSDGTAKKLSMEAVQARMMRAKLAKLRKTLYVLVKQHRNTQNTRTKFATSGIARRRFAVRMQLSYQAVIQTIRCLIRLICESPAMLSAPTQIILFKVCAKLGVHGCRNPISFRQMMESVGVTQNLLTVVLENSAHYEWIRHALLCFVLDVVEAEGPTQSGVEVSESAESLNTFKACAETEPNTPEAKVKRRKENPETENETEEKDMSPMDDENACSASTSTFVTNIDDDETVTISTTKNDTDTEATNFENLVISPTILASGISDGYSTGVGEEREVHPALLEEKSGGTEATVYPFSFPMFDKPSENNVDSLIVMALFALRPIEMKNPTYWDNYRDWFVRQIAFAVSRALYDKGEPISDIFRWFDYVLGAEMEAASNSKSENNYVKWGLLSLIHAADFIEREFGVSGKLAMTSEKNPSHSALTCAAYYSQFYSLFENNVQSATDEEDPNFLFLDDNFEPAFDKSTLSARGQSEASNFIADLMSIVEKRRLSGGNSALETTDEESVGSRFYENLESNYLPVDCGEDVVHFVAMRGCMPLCKMVFTFSKLRFIQSFIQVRRCVKNLPYVHVPDPDELVRMKPLEGEKRPKSASVKTVTRSEKSKSERSERREVDVARDEMMHYRAAMNVHFLNSRCCPMALGLEHLSTAFLEVHMASQLRRCQAERLVCQCHFLNRMAPSLQRTVKMSTVYDTRILPGMDTCSAWIVQAVNHIFTELNAHQANERPAHTSRFGGGLFFQNLINFFWDFQGNTIANRSHGTDVNFARTFVLSEKAIEGLIRFAIRFEYMNEQTWGQLLKMLIAVDTPIESQDSLKESKSYKFVQWVENSDDFLPLIHKFLMSSMSRLSSTVSACPSYGPAVGNIFGRFMGIIFKQITPRVMDSILEVLTVVLREGRECGYVNFPVEMILEMTAAMDRMDRVCPCSTDKFAMFLNGLMDFVSDFFSEIQRVQKHIGDEAQVFESPLIRTNDPSQISSNICFSVVLGPNGQRERTALMNERFRAANTSGSKTMKNIAFTKRADILENALRDGDISSNSPILSVAYSLLRLVVRYVSQYRPLLKAIVNEKNHCLKRAVDTLFMFISCTNHIDEINAENFKIVTVADALVHFLLIVSETSVEDPECGRQFIVLVINSLRARVTVPSSANIPSTSQLTPSPIEPTPTLMDLPVPLLLLMKTLLSSVTRCQSFVEENGHIFVAEQLQLSLDACAQDWPAHAQFSNISRELNALTSHLTGCESANPLVNSAAPVRVVNPAQICPSTSTRARRPAEAPQAVSKSAGGTYFTSASVQCSSATSSPLTAPPVQPNLSLTCPSVTLQHSNVQSAHHPFLGSIMPSTSRGCLSIRSVPPSIASNLGPKDDQFNFAPIATFRSDLVPPSQLSMLSALPDKRGRTNTFTYKFTMKREWIDFAMVLPYKVVLSEVIIRIPENFASNAPSAVQLELSSDPLQSSWTVVGCPVAPGNCAVTRISVTSYRFPVTGIRIHLKCPTASPTLSIAQIQLIGSTSVRSMRFMNDARMLESQLMNHWVTLFTRLCTRIDVPAWKYAPTLAESLIKVYLGEGHSPEIIRQVYDLLLRLDFNAKPSQNSLVAVVVNYLIDGGRVCPRAYLSVAELVHASCVLPSTTHHPQRIGQETRSVNVTHSTAVARQRQLLMGIQKLLTDVLPQTQDRIEESNWLRPEFLKEIAVLLWSSACVLWHNTSEVSIRYDTIAVCLEVGPVIIPPMARFVLYVRDHTLFCASCWMLCTLGRASSTHLNQIFECLNLTVPDTTLTPKVLNALGKICQSATAVQYLIEKGFIQQWSKTVIEICTQHQHYRINELLGIVDCLNQISVIDTAAEYFDRPNESELFRELLKYVVKFCLATLRSEEEHNPTTMSNRLADATISLLRHCLSYGGGHRQRIAQMMTDILVSSYSSSQKGFPLPSTVEDVLLRLIVADETITVRLTGVVNRRNQFNQSVEERMLHPLFGCNQDDRIVELSLSTLCQDLLPVKKRKARPIATKSSRTSQTLPNFEDWVIGSQLKFDDPEDKESAPPSDNRPSTSDASTNTDVEYKFMYNQFVLQMICGAYSTKRSLNTSWSLSKVIDGLRAIRRFGSRQSEDISLLEKYMREDEEMGGIEQPPQGDESMDVEVKARATPMGSPGPSRGARASPNLWSAQPHQSRSQSASSNSPTTEEGEFTDGYFTLTLRVKATLQTNVMTGMENESLFESIPQTTSTLFHFAQCGGLKILSRSVDLLSRVEARIKMMISLSNQLQDGGTVKDDLEMARRNIVQCPLRQRNTSPLNSQQLDSQYRLLYDYLEVPVMHVFNALRMLSTNGVKVTAPQYAAPLNTGEDTPPKAMTAQNYGPIIDPIILDPQQPTLQDDLMTMVDFMNSEIVSSSPKPITITSTAALQSFSAAPFTSYENDFTDDLVTPVIQGGFFPAAYLDLGPSFSSESKPSYVVKVPVTLQMKSDSMRSAQNQSKLSKNTESLEFTMLALSNFLEIDSYPETLVECDPSAAKKLIYMMLGIDTPMMPRNDAVDGLAPLLPLSTLGVSSDLQNLEDVEETVRERMRFATRLITDHFMGVSENSPTVQQKEMEMERLLLVPFLALSRCFENAHPSRMPVAQTEQIRMSALQNGSVDIVLTLLAHYSHQTPLRQPIRESGDFVVTNLMHRLITFSADVQSFIGLFSSAPKPPTRPRLSKHVPLGASAVSTYSASNEETYWAKGTGFGSGNTSTQWNLGHHVAKRKQHEITVTCLLNVLTNFIKPQLIASTPRLIAYCSEELANLLDSPQSSPGVSLPEPPRSTNPSSPDLNPFIQLPAEFVSTVQRSCLNTTLNSYMMNDSVLDISRHAVVYESVVGLLLAICSSAPVGQNELVNIGHMSDLVLDTDEHFGCSIFERLKKLCACVDIYMSKLKSTGEPTTLDSASLSHKEENLSELLNVAKQAVDLMKQRDKIRRQTNESAGEEEKMEEERSMHIFADEEGYITGQSLEVEYNEMMKPRQFETIPFFQNENTPRFPYIYSNSMASIQGTSGKRTRRLAQEIVTLSTSLPLSLSSSVFLRNAEERLDVMKVLITGPADTPYSCGCFEFDVYFPQDYPNVPMLMNLQTTGNRSVRFNPNLYEEGKVCLSILNTWSGRPEERWNSENSSFLQVLVSIQSLIFVAEPYFNEPGFERSRGTQQGDQSSRDYTANIRHQCIRWAMIEQLRKPSPAFADVIRRHFWVKRDEICLQIRKWITETREMVAKNTLMKTIPQHLTLMEKNFEALLNEFNKMECPSPELSHINSKFVHEHFHPTAEQPQS